MLNKEVEMSNDKNNKNKDKERKQNKPSEPEKGEDWEQDDFQKGGIDKEKK